LFGEELTEAVEALLPALAAFVDPFFGSLERAGFEAAGANAPGFFGSHQTARLEHLQVELELSSAVC
jgi:hypothetical protein